MYLAYKFWYVIPAVMVAVIAIFIFVTPKIDKKYQKYGYTGYNDNIKHDLWTGEIIPKQEIDTYNNDEKYIINSKSEQIKFNQMKELIKQYNQIQGNNAFINESNLDSLTSICNILLKDYLDLDFEIKPFGNLYDKNYVFKVKGEYENSYYSDFSSTPYLEGLVKEVVKDKYRSQNYLKDEI